MFFRKDIKELLKNLKEVKFAGIYAKINKETDKKCDEIIPNETTKNKLPNEKNRKKFIDNVEKIEEVLRKLLEINLSLEVTALALISIVDLSHKQDLINRGMVREIIYLHEFQNVVRDKINMTNSDWFWAMEKRSEQVLKELNNIIEKLT